MKKTYKLRFGKKAKYNCFGLCGCSHGRYDGGFNHYAFGIKGVICFQILHAWGSGFHDMKI